MIGHADIVERVGEWQLREDIVEKDYVLGWVLWGLGQHPRLADTWIFKGGTCLKKCYIETYRFSEDLDFTVVPGGPVDPDEVRPLIDEVLRLVGDESGIDFAVREPRLRARPSGTSTEGRLYYRGPRQSPVAASIKIDLSADEPVVRPPVLRPIAHPYPDGLPGDATVRSYSLEEVFAEKLRAMAQRNRPRDLYDVINLYRRHDLRPEVAAIREVLERKCAAKGIAVPTSRTLAALPNRVELDSEWENMLGHQLPALPPIEGFLSELETLFAWLEGTEPTAPPPVPQAAEEDTGWSPPPTVATWQAGVPLEVVRFAATNRLCVELGYRGSVRVVEPYSLRRTRAGAVVLHALRADDRGHRSYRVDRIESVRATTRPFTPVYAVEFSTSGPLSVPPAPSGGRAATRGHANTQRGKGSLTYVVQCSGCGRRFHRRTRNTRMRPHKAPSGQPCPSKHGHLVDVGP